MAEVRLVERRGSRSASPESQAPNAIVAVAILIAAEMMFFGGLITALLVLRAGAIIWPPPGSPDCPWSPQV